MIDRLHPDDLLVRLHTAIESAIGDDQFWGRVRRVARSVHRALDRGTVPSRLKVKTTRGILALACRSPEVRYRRPAR